MNPLAADGSRDNLNRNPCGSRQRLWAKGHCGLGEQSGVPAESPFSGESLVIALSGVEGDLDNTLYVLVSGGDAAVSYAEAPGNGGTYPGRGRGPRLRLCWS